MVCLEVRAKKKFQTPAVSLQAFARFIKPVQENRRMNWQSKSRSQFILN
jgi:hypothetical protein